MFGKDKKPEDKEPENPNAAMEKLLLELPNSIQQSVVAGVAAAMKGMQAPVAPVAPVKVEAAPPLIPDGLDLSELDNKGVIELLVGAMDTKFKQLGDSLSPRFDELSNNMRTNDIKSQVKEAAAADPDFWKYRDVMASVAKEYPNLAPADIFALAKSKAPEIGETLDKERADAKAEEDAKNKPATMSFGGLTPTSGHSTSDGEPMEFHDASSSAWDEAMADVPAEIIGGTNH